MVRKPPANSLCVTHVSMHLLRSAGANQCANDLELRIRQAAVTSAVRPNVDDMALKAPFNDIGDICKYNLDVS
ncbi:hypothetical protein D3C80_2101170 [compost metagenome]